MWKYWFLWAYWSESSEYNGMLIYCILGTCLASSEHIIVYNSDHQNYRTLPLFDCHLMPNVLRVSEGKLKSYVFLTHELAKVMTLPIASHNRSKCLFFLQNIQSLLNLVLSTIGEGLKVSHTNPVCNSIIHFVNSFHPCDYIHVQQSLTANLL